LQICSSKLLNFDETCGFFKKSIYTIIGEVKDLDDPQLKSLNQYSYRGFAHDLIKTAKFDFIDSLNLQRALISLNGSGGVLNLYFDLDESGLDNSALLEKKKTAEESLQTTTKTLNKDEAQLKSQKDKIGTIVKLMPESVTNSIEFVNKCSNFIKQLEINDEPNDYLVSVIEMILEEKEFKDSNITQELNKLKPFVAEVNMANFIIENYNRMKLKVLSDVMEVVNFSDLETEVKNIIYYLYYVKKSAKSIITKIKKTINSSKSAIEKMILKDKQYPQYLKLMKSSINLAKKIEKTRVLMLEQNKQLTDLEEELQLLSWRKVKFSQNRIDKYFEKIDSIKNLKEFDFSDYLKSTTIHKNFRNAIKAFKNGLDNNKHFLETSSKVYERMSARISFYTEQETSVDKILALTLLYLQNNPEHGKCFQSEEMSTLLYYMNITQVIFNKKAFVDQFLEGIEGQNSDKPEKLSLKFIRKYNETSYNELAKADPAERKELIAVKLSSFMIKHDFNLFEKFNKVKIEEKKSAVYKGLMKVVGFTKEAIKFAATYTVVSLIIKKLLIALFGTFSIGLGYGIAIYLAVGLVKFLLHELIHWLSHQNYITKDKLKNLFGAIFSSVIGYFNNDVISLDYEFVLKEEAKKEFDTLRSKSLVLKREAVDNEAIMKDELNVLIQKYKRIEVTQAEANEESSSNNLVII
jgi:hypothetical protein